MKILLTIRGDFISPRFDMTGEVVIATCYDRKMLEEPRSIILSEYSAEKICDIALKEKVQYVVCGGIEEKHYQFLSWKKIKVIDSVIGPYADAIEKILQESLHANTILSGVTSCGMTV
jgi:predicted Fe-Mo cluster-binding NifX family protein